MKNLTPLIFVICLIGCNSEEISKNNNNVNKTKFDTLNKSQDLYIVSNKAKFDFNKKAPSTSFKDMPISHVPLNELLNSADKKYFRVTKDMGIILYFSSDESKYKQLVIPHEDLKYIEDYTKMMPYPKNKSIDKVNF